MRRFLISLIPAMIMVLGMSGVVLAEELTVTELAGAIDTIWVLLAACLVFLMHAGFTLVETGFTRAKNAVNIIMKNLLTISLGVIIFFLVGFALAFGSDQMGLFGSTGWVLTGLDEADFGIPLYAFWFFQAVFAATAATIVSGAMAERTKLTAYIMFTIIITALTYPVVVHWVWGGGWLAEMGFIDFAGSTVVHGVGGWSALIGAWLVGARAGKYGKDGKPNAIPGHNIPLGALGVFLLWLGWFGFNAGSTLSGTTPDIAAVATTTILAGAAGVISSMILSWFRYGKPDISLTLNGALGGLVGITAGTASVSPLGAMVIGLVAGAILVLAVEVLDRYLKVDDPVGAITVHAICGVVGTLAVGLFALDGGLFYGGGTSLLIVQAIGVLAVAGWSIGMALISFKVIGAITGGLRVSADEEYEGLDLGEHGISAYDSIPGVATSPVGIHH